METEWVIVTSRDFTKMARAEMQKEHGPAFSEEVFKKALGKAQRHAADKYGKGPRMMESEFNESGFGNVSFFYTETAADTTGGIDTENRRMDLQRRKGGKVA